MTPTTSTEIDMTLSELTADDLVAAAALLTAAQQAAPHLAWRLSSDGKHAFVNLSWLDTEIAVHHVSDQPKPWTADVYWHTFEGDTAAEVVGAALTKASASLREAADRIEGKANQQP